VAYHSRKFKPADVNWEHFATSSVLTARRACRSEHHVDVLSRRWDNALKEGGEPSPVGFFNCTIRFQCSSGIHENPVESERGIRGYHRWNRGLELDVQVVSCGWKAQPLFCTDANMWLVLIRRPRQ
jgi:hypothetical protein